MPQDLHGFLNPNDPVAISFWIISISMIAATVLFLMGPTSVSAHWKTSMNVGDLVTLVAGVHYMYMREFWVTIHMSLILYRYIDRSITVPLQMIELHLILSATASKIGQGSSWKLLIGTVVILAAGYTIEAGFVSKMIGLVVGMAGWFFILFETFAGEAGNWQRVLAQPHQMSRLHSARCGWLPVRAGSSIPSVTSSATSWAPSVPTPEISSTTSLTS